MKKVLALAASLLCLSFFASAAKAARPNFIVFQVDDMPRSALGVEYRSSGGNKLPLFPNLLNYFQNGGMNFTDFAAASPVCSPSRASLLSGQYPHNNRVVSNSGDLGGALGWMNSPAWRDNLVTRLQARGYHTAHFGKWINQYGEETPDYLPPGWDTWVSDTSDISTRDFYGYYQRWTIPRLGIDTTVGPIGDPTYSYGDGLDPRTCRIKDARIGFCNYHSDLMTRMAGDEIRAAEDPFYLQVDYHAPHGDYAPPAGPQAATRHLRLWKKIILPKKPLNFNEGDTSDKTYLSRVNNGLLRQNDKKAVDNFQRHALLSLKAVDDGIGYVMRLLEKRGVADNTYFIFLSDNGFFFGNHRFRLGKIAMYEEASKVPFLIRGPGVIPGSTSAYRASTVDFAPTVLELAGAKHQGFDGQSLAPSLLDPALLQSRMRLVEVVSEGELRYETDWKDPFLEVPLLPDRPAGPAPPYKYRTLQFNEYKYLSYDKGGEELYDLARDPHEMNSLHQDPNYLGLLAYMRGALAKLRMCRGKECAAIPSIYPVKKDP